jgi:enamine deaminase RidA (YjgF/YER057c/UK114 family)
MVAREGSPSPGAERRLIELGIKLPAPPQPFGTYVEAVQTGKLLFLSGMLPTDGREAKFIGRVGAELDTESAYRAARVAALNALAVARQHLGSLDKVTRIVRLGVSVVTAGRRARSAESRRWCFGAAAGHLREGQKPLSVSGGRREPSARHSGCVGAHFGGGVTTETPVGQRWPFHNPFSPAPVIPNAANLPHIPRHPCNARTIQFDGAIPGG